MEKEKGDISPANAQHRVTMLHAILLYCVLLLSTVHAQPVDTGSRNLLFRGRMAISDSPVKAVHDAYRPETSAADRDATLGREAT
ncbi:hypothetical protein LMH87_012058 [Akanthomyces muscarius]|uniref:Uncharacterized protein n=1 Tax=Akanthomyces muscarius TaxID=2231603 RepID=A0A9W8ULE5_AKAMU|nr:hypothetical protein LMH87_012058 [Akanthomyces muscarius]KAJ4151354.1 hypothetical protein LMH87_012058 [Akanthomyces muscarius]